MNVPSSGTSEPAVLLFGGASRERRVSVASAQHVARELLEVDPEPPACWFWAPGGSVFEVDAGELLDHAHPFEIDLQPAWPPRWPDLESAVDAAAARDRVILLALHGGIGEDGTLQRMLEDRGIAFTGSGSYASARAFDKALAQEVAWRHGLRVPEACVVDGRDLFRARAVLGMLLARYDGAVLKPVADGSSHGLFLIHDASDVEKALDALREAPGVVHLAEAFVAGIELTVGVIDASGGPRALPCSEVRVAAGRSFDYDAKYLGRGAVELTPAEVPEETARAAQEAALRAHRALDCEGYSRTDVIVDEAGPVYVETNTLPGLTAASFFPRQLVADGSSLGAFLETELDRARSRRRTRRARTGGGVLQRDHATRPDRARRFPRHRGRPLR